MSKILHIPANVTNLNSPKLILLASHTKITVNLKSSDNTELLIGVNVFLEKPKRNFFKESEVL